jgi:alanine racemase
VLEKWKLFINAHVIICNNQDEVVTSVIQTKAKEQLFIWGDSNADLTITNVEKHDNTTTITGRYINEAASITIPFTDNASIENAITCWSVLLFLK